jgi:tape measure domain-containing protein
VAVADNDINIKITAENLVQTAIDAAIKSFNQMGDTAKTVADRLGASFKTLDIKSAFDIGNDRQRIIAAYQSIANSGVASAGEINRARTAMQEKLGALTAAEFSHINVQKQGQAATVQTGQSLDGMFGKAGAGIIVFNQLSQVVGTAWRALNAAVEPALKMEKMNAVLKAATGSATEAGYAMQFVGDESKRLNTDLEAGITTFARLATATKNTSMEGEATRRMFTGFSEAFSVLKLSTEQTNSAFTQITQGINKGKLELEDLKIIAEAGVPVFELLSQSMGKSRPEIMKMISDGQLLANEVYPKLADQLHATFGVAAVEAAGSATNSMTALKNELFANAAAMGQDLLPAFQTILGGLAKLVEFGGFAVNVIKTVTSGFIGLGFAALETGKLILGGIFSSEGRQQFVTNMNGIVEVFTGDLDKMLGASKTFHKTDAQLAAEKAEADKRRLKESQDSLAANTKARDDYTKTIANLEARLTLQETAEYETRKKTVNAYYASLLAGVTKGSADEAALIIKRNSELERLEGERRTIGARVALEVKDAALKAQAAENAAVIAEIQKGIATKIISEEAGNAKILAIRRGMLDEELKLAEQRVSVLAVSGMKGTDEYQKALEAQAKAQEAVNAAIVANTKATTEARAREWGIAADRFKAAMTTELADIQARETAGILTTKEAATARLKVELNYLEQIASLRAQQAAAFNPATQTAEYVAARQVQLDADKQVIDKQKALRDAAAADEVTTRKQVIASEMAFTGDFNAWFRAQWQAAIDDGTKLLQGLSDAVYNAFARMNDLPQKLGEGISTALSLSKQLAQEAATIWETEHASNLRWGGSLAGVFDKLTALKAEAKALAAEFYGEKAAADILTAALKGTTLASEGQLTAIEGTIAGFTRLDDKQLTAVKGEVDRLRKALEDLETQSRETLRALQDELDQMTGNVTAVELRAFEDKRVEILNQLEAAKKVNEQDAVNNLTQALSILDTIYQAKVKNAAEEQRLDAGIVTARLDAARTEADFRAATIQSNAKKEADLNLANHQAVMAQYDAQTMARQTLAQLGEKARTGMAWGGKLPGGDSKFDSIPVLARPGEWFIRNESAGFWGDNVMKAINEPFSQAGRVLANIFSGPLAKFAQGGKTSELDLLKARYNIIFDAPENHPDHQLAEELAQAIANVEARNEDIVQRNEEKFTDKDKMLRDDKNMTPSEKVEAMQLDAIDKEKDPFLKYELKKRFRTMKAELKMAWGGKLPGGDSKFDSIPVLARPGEWFIRNESAGFWGDNVMAGINEPLSRAGQMIQAKLMGIRDLGPGIGKSSYWSPVPGSGLSGPAMGTIELKLGDAVYPVQGKVDVISSLTTAVRRMRKAGMQ